MQNEIVQVEKINKRFGKLHAVRDLSFSVPEASCVGLIGPNGAGKTTTLSIMIGRTDREKDHTSNISIFGYDPKDNGLEIKFRSGVVPQEANLDSELKVRQNLMIYSKFYGMKKREASERIEELLEFLELSQKGDARIKELSGGMKRRLLIARALLNRPKLLILDEPTTGLDPQVRHHIWDRIKRLQKSGVTILLTTQYMEEAANLCDSIILMNEGTKILEGNPNKLVADRGVANLEELFLKMTGTVLNEKY